MLLNKESTRKVLEYLEFTQLSNFSSAFLINSLVLEYLEFTQLSNWTTADNQRIAVLEYLEFTQLSNHRCQCCYPG